MWRRLCHVGATIKPASSFTWVGNYMFGKEQADTEPYRHVWDTTATVQAAPNIALMANYVYGMDRVFGQRVRWQGIAGYARFTHKRVRVSPRWEWYADPQNFTLTQVPAVQNLAVKEFTGTGDVVLNDSLFLRGEYRVDYSDNEIFEYKDGTQGPKKSRHSLLIGFVYTFNKMRL